MYFKLYYFYQGPDVFVRIFAGPDWEHLGLSGNLTFRHEEWQWFMRLFIAGTEAIERVVAVRDKRMAGAPLAPGTQSINTNPRA